METVTADPLETIPVLDIDPADEGEKRVAGPCHLLDGGHAALCNAPTNYGVEADRSELGPTCTSCGKGRCPACVAVFLKEERH